MISGVSLASELSSLPYVCIVEDEGAKTYFCSECKLQLGNIYSMKRHIVAQHTDIKEKCPICDEEFKTVVKKRHHLHKNHNLEEVKKGKQRELREIPKLFCELCKKEYKSKAGLQIHMTNFHTLEKCPDCPSFLPAIALAIHRNDVHSTPIPTCGICGYRNALENRVLLHQRQVHLKEKTVACDICNMTFFDMKLLKRHLIKHKPDRIHECSYCHKKFPRKNTLRMHEKIHKGEKNKVCSLCGERFVQKASLNHHMMKRHPDAC